MIVKKLHFDEEGRQKLKTGITTISSAVKSTLGPRGRTVLMESENHTGGITITKDGVTVARGINLMDPVENLAVQLMRQAADRTATIAGDGTSTSVVLTEAIINAADEFTDEKSNMIEVTRHINSIASELDNRLVKMSRKVSGKMLQDVAKISSNNDPVIGKLIADTYNEASYVTVENAQDHNTRAEVAAGIKINRGFSHRIFINDFKKNACVLENPLVLITDHEISNLRQIESVLTVAIKSQRPLFIIGQLTPNTMATIAKNIAAGNMKVCNIIPPSFGLQKDELMSDLAVALGGVYLSGTTGDNILDIQESQLGSALKIVVNADSTVIIPSESQDKEAVDARIGEIKSMLENNLTPKEKEFIHERIANISGSIGVIYVGANSDIEQKELRDRVDDAVLAVRAAIEEGILPGAGQTLIDAFKYIKQPVVIGEDRDYESAYNIMNKALLEPFCQILRNAGMDWNVISLNIDSDKTNGYGFDVKNERYGDLIKLGVIDPTKVTRAALSNAVSVATTIMSTNAIITNVRDGEVEVVAEKPTEICSEKTIVIQPSENLNKLILIAAIASAVAASVLAIFN